jgi:twitching motility two-component system response regulator PilG
MLHKILLSRELAETAPLATQRTSGTQSKADLSAVSFLVTSSSNLWAQSYPAYLTQTQSPQALQIPPQPVHPSQKFILVIDDSATVRKILETCLRREDFQVESFHDGVEAIRWLTEPQARIPDLVWLDIGLPKMDGYEVARCLKTRPKCSKTVIVMLTRRDGIVDRLKGRLAGARAYMTKPFTTQDSVSVTRSLLELAPA